MRTKKERRKLHIQKKKPQHVSTKERKNKMTK